VTPSVLGMLKRVTRCATRPVPVTVRTRWLTIGEGGMSSPPPSAAQMLERASVEFAIHKQRKVNLPGERRRTDLLQH